MFFLDPILLLVTMLGAGLCGWASLRVQSTFKRYQDFGVRSGMSGRQAAEAICRVAGMNDVQIEKHQGFLSDHYDPRSRSLRLSPAVHDGRSIASVAVAAHEAGHAIQDSRDYAWLGLRSQLVPIANFGNRGWSLVLVLGILAGGYRGEGVGRLLLIAAAVLFGGVVLFQLVTLPVEIDASRRAKAVLAQTGIVQTSEEARGVEKVLDAAALTYVAAALAGLLQLAYLIARIVSASRDE